MTHILICTVGGSHQPIVSAINEQRPDYVIFICTDKDPATGRPGSSIQITGTGNCIKAKPQDEKPTLPNIPAQTGLTAEQHEVCCTLSDDLGRIYLDCSNAIDAALRRFANAKIIADYTGGTKSLSAGLAMAALEHQGIELQLVTGSRADLIKVHDGSQFVTYANIEQIRFERLLEWTAQWLLKTHCNIDTANVDATAIPKGMTLTQNRDGQWQAGLFIAWQLVKHKTAGEAARFIQKEESNLLNHIKIRNGSILAHGYEPVKASDWQAIQAWLEQQFIPMLLAEAAKTGFKELPTQLPLGFELR